jgi:hypothetical protein
VQFQPELVTATNKAYDGFDRRYPDFTWAQYYEYYQGIIDRPEQFGTSSYSKVLPGQSSVRINVARFSFGFSTENLWWGPGQYNSLLMSNTAQGFNHFTFNTRRPLRTPAGSFELQAIAGKLEDSGFAPPGAARRFQGNPLYLPKNTSWRYLSGLVFNWQPRWVPGLFLGYARTVQAYHRDLTKAYQVPLLLPFQRFDYYGDPRLAKYDQYYSLMARWLFPSANGEIYFEYGRNNHSYLYENYPANSSHTRAYVAGIKKLIPLPNGTDQLQVNIEATELSAPADYVSKPGETWYVNSYVRQGYTHKGQLLGAGIGPGGSVQTLDVSWFRNTKRIGLQLERYVHNNDLYYYLFESVRDVRRHWVDMSLTANAQWDFHNFLLSSRIAAVKLLNYQYYLDPEKEYVNFAKGRDVVNVRAELGFAYRF